MLVKKALNWTWESEIHVAAGKIKPCQSGSQPVLKNAYEATTRAIVLRTLTKRSRSPKAIQA